MYDHRGLHLGTPLRLPSSFSVRWPASAGFMASTSFTIDVGQCLCSKGDAANLWAVPHYHTEGSALMLIYSFRPVAPPDPEIQIFIAAGDIATEKEKTCGRQRCT